MLRGATGEAASRAVRESYAAAWKCVVRLNVFNAHSEGMRSQIDRGSHAPLWVGTAIMRSLVSSLHQPGDLFLLPRDFTL